MKFVGSIFSAIEQGVLYVRQNPQLLFSLILIVLIPFAFLFNGQLFLKVSNDNRDRLEHDRIGIMHDVFASLLIATQFDPEVAQNEIERITDLNPDITKFRVAEDRVEGVVPIAAKNTKVIGVVEESSSSYRISQPHEGESLITAYVANDIRYLQSFRLIRDTFGREYYIFTETSLEQLDALFHSRIVNAYIWLAILIVIVMLLVIRHVRLIDYVFLYRETKRANQMKDLFTNMIAHELRAPLTAMRGYASMIREKESVDSEVREQARRIEESSERLVVIVSDLLDVARIQSGKLHITKDDVNISDVIQSVGESLEASAKTKDTTLDYDTVPKSVTIFSDSKRLHQALTNLISNSIKYTPKGSITVSLEERNDRVEIRVKDTGMGIAAEDQSKLFAPFFRVASKDVSQITGTGLGMWITKELIELMNGSIGVESIKGVGTQIVITLPKT